MRFCEPVARGNCRSFSWNDNKCVFLDKEIQEYAKQQVTEEYAQFKDDFKRWKEEHMSFVDLKGRYETAVTRQTRVLTSIEQSIVTGQYRKRGRGGGNDTGGTGMNSRPLQRVKVSLTAFMEKDEEEEECNSNQQDKDKDKTMSGKRSRSTHPKKKLKIKFI